LKSLVISIVAFIGAVSYSNTYVAGMPAGSVVTPEMFTGTTRVQIQSAFDAIRKNGGTVKFRGKYKLDDTYADPKSRSQLILGGDSSAKDVTLDLSAAEIFQGGDGRMLVISNARNITIHGGKWWGYTGGTLDYSREHDALISIVNNSQSINISGGYFTNFLGDGIYVIGDLSNTITNNAPQNIKIHDNTFKERVGNGILSSDRLKAGTRSRETVAIIQGTGISIIHNILR
jgi:hypothetical protein